ncbi:hypothetical protein GCM10011579_041770 [Streptomyces albiflavescens]|uniref:Uncharacterized protein n=1 Tax=Streptomyces albiflavescens TaxID=1623582 RepID=A0A917Y5M8_9ACTN|nr:hypothetical protein GCM10011579_041770 [Streptomyces albiflavescens]
MEPEQNAPVMDIRIGGFRMTVQRIPVKLLTLLTATACSGFTAWITGR